LEGDHLVAVDSDPPVEYPIVNDIPILLNSERSVFSAEEIAREARAPKQGTQSPKRTSIKHRVARRLPALGLNLKAKKNFDALRRLLLEATPSPRVLVLGGGVLGTGVNQLTGDPQIDVVESDVYIDVRTQIVIDSHEIPFEDATFDGVIIQGVLGVLLDPAACVSEIHRVLKKEGLVYAEAPFVQQACYALDLHRFSHLGLLRLFRRFSEVDSGAQGGPGMVCAWSYLYFLLSLTSTKRGRMAAHVTARLTGWWVPLLDRWLIDRPAAIDGASGVFFLGCRSNQTMSDIDLVKKYRGKLPG